MNAFVIWDPVAQTFESVGGRQIWSEETSCAIAAKTLGDKRVEIRPVKIEPQLYKMDFVHWEKVYQPTKLEMGREEEMQFIRSNAPHIWTSLDADGHFVITSGFHWVNRLDHFFTSLIPWGEIDIDDDDEDWEFIDTED